MGDGGYEDITFPISFPNAVFTVSSDPRFYNGKSNGPSLTIRNVTLTGFGVINVDNTVSSGQYWIAIGY